MDYTFLNGSEQQRSRWSEGAFRLLNLPADLLNLDIEVEFVDPGDVSSNGHTDLASTTLEYDSPSSTMNVRNDAPSFGAQRRSLEAEAAAVGLRYSVDRFYTETSIHELGHALFAALPQEMRIAIAQLFGAEGDDPSELAPEGEDWKNRIAEGIAETFKEAFLPRRFRVFSNRTKRVLSYSKFAEFRRLFRDGIAAIPGEEGETIEVLKKLDVNE